jgi:hypothetical protein
MSIEAHHDTRLKSLIQANSTAMHVDLAKAVCFVIAAFVVLAPSRLTAQAPVSSVRNADSTVSQAPDAAETNESAELAQKLANPLAKLISIPIQNWFDFNLGPRKDGLPLPLGLDSQAVRPARTP